MVQGMGNWIWCAVKQIGHFGGVAQAWKLKWWVPGTITFGEWGSLGRTFRPCDSGLGIGMLSEILGWGISASYAAPGVSIQGDYKSVKQLARS